MESHLLQMRGLKLNCILPSVKLPVASFTDAWIETSFRMICYESISRIFYRCVD